MFVSSSNWLGRYLRKKHSFNSEFSQKIIIFGFGFGFSESGQCFPVWGSWFGSVQVLVRTAQHEAWLLEHAGLAHQPLSAQLQPFQIGSGQGSPFQSLPWAFQKEKLEFKRKRKSSLGPHSGERQELVPEMLPPTRRKSKYHDVWQLMPW